MPGPLDLPTAAWPTDDMDGPTELDGRTAPDPQRASVVPLSREELLQRATELGPRLTWESVSIGSPDPILGEKMQPHVAARRARFRKVVKGAVATCLGCCLLALIVTAVSGETASAATTAIKNAPASGITSIEKLEVPGRAKLSRASTYASFPTYSVAHAKTGKRR